MKGSGNLFGVESRVLRRQEPSEKGAGNGRETGGKWERKQGMKGVETGSEGIGNCNEKGVGTRREGIGNCNEKGVGTGREEGGT